MNQRFNIIMDCVDELLESVNSENLPAVKQILENGCVVDAQNHEGTSALQMASVNGFDDIAQFLLSRNASVDLPNAYGWTPLMLAARYGHISTMGLLLKYHAKVNTSNKIGLTPITAAVFSGEVSAVTLLLEAGAILNYNTLKDPHLYVITPLMAASLLGYNSIVDLLLEKKAAVDCFSNVTGWTPLMLASCGGYKKIVMSLIEHGADATKVDVCRRTALKIATLCSRKKVRCYLESMQYSKSNKTRGNIEAKILKAVVKENFEEVKSLLLNDPSCVNAQDPSDGMSILMLASMQGNYNVVQLLLQNKVNIHAQDSVEGWTALTYAVFHRHINIITLLLDSGADMYSRTLNGYTVLDLVHFMEDNDQLLELLLSKAATTTLSFRSGSPLITSPYLSTLTDKKIASHLFRSNKKSSSSSPSTRMKGWFSNKFHTMFRKSSPRRPHFVSSPEIKVSLPSPSSSDVFNTPPRNMELPKVKLSLSAMKSPNRYLASSLKKHQVEPITPPFLDVSTSDDDELSMQLYLCSDPQDKHYKSPVPTLNTPHLLKDYTKTAKAQSKKRDSVSRNLFFMDSGNDEDSFKLSKLETVKHKQKESKEKKMNVPVIPIKTPLEESVRPKKKIAEDKDNSLSQLLEKKSLSKHISKFKEQEIDINAFKCLKKDDFLEIGIDSTLSREELENILSNLQRTTDV